MIPDKSFSFAKARKSDSLMKFPEFLFLGFLNKRYELIGFDIMAVNTEMSVFKQMHDECKKHQGWVIDCSPVTNCI
jgi:hypothetical protein